MTDTLSIGFRTRTGQARRAQTRRKILKATLELFDQDKVDRVTIDDVRVLAGLSRGTFYNYFPTLEAMLTEITADIATQINLEQTQYFGAIPDLAMRLCQNVRYFITRTAADRACGNILLRVVPLVGAPNQAMRELPQREMTEALASGVINIPSIAVAVDVGIGIGSAMVQRGLAHGITEAEIEGAGLMLLRALGVAEDKALAISKIKLPPLPATSLSDKVIAQEFGQP